MFALHAIYGCIESALYWYKLYSETLMEKGLELNQYYRCARINWYIVNNVPLCGMWNIKKCHIWKKISRGFFNDLKNTLKSY